MKPDEARARRRMVEERRRAASDGLREYLENAENPLDVVVPELIPSETDRDGLRRELRRLGRRAEARPRGPARNRKLDEMCSLVFRLVVAERVLALDRLERAALTPRKLQAIARDVTMDEMQRMIASLAGVEEGPEVLLP